MHRCDWIFGLVQAHPISYHYREYCNATDFTQLLVAYTQRWAQFHRLILIVRWNDSNAAPLSPHHLYMLRMRRQKATYSVPNRAVCVRNVLITPSSTITRDKTSNCTDRRAHKHAHTCARDLLANFSPRIWARQLMNTANVRVCVCIKAKRSMLSMPTPNGWKLKWIQENLSK